MYGSRICMSTASNIRSSNLEPNIIYRRWIDFDDGVLCENSVKMQITKLGKKLILCIATIKFT